MTSTLSGREKILQSAELFKNNFINNKIATKYYLKTNWLVKVAICNELLNIIHFIPHFTDEQHSFLINQCNFIKCLKCKTYKNKHTHCKKCKIMKKINKTEIICSDEECSICFETLNNCILTLCNHKFHKECLFNCFIANKNCPLCRSNI
jgi:hypothetical protein